MEGGIISLRVILRDLFQPKQLSRCWWVSGEPKQAAESPHTDLTVRGVTRHCGKPSSAFPALCKCLSPPGNAHREALRTGPPGQAFPEGAEIQGLPGRLLAVNASSVVAQPAHSTALLPTSQPHGGLSPAPAGRAADPFCCWAGRACPQHKAWKDPGPCPSHGIHPQQGCSPPGKSISPGALAQGWSLPAPEERGSTFCASRLALRLPRLPNSRLCVLQLCNSDTCTMPFSQRFWGFSVLLAVLCELRLKTFRLRIRG